jgi:CheY-like chemotaxis protein
VFHVLLPRLAETASLAETEAHQQASLWGSETILVVEDQDLVRNLACDILERYGYRVVEARSGAEAIALVQRYPETIHLLLTDVILPRMNGRALAEALQALRPGLRVLYTSGHPEEVIGEDAVLGPETPYLRKPYSPEDLAASVRKALGERVGSEVGKRGE